MREFIADDGKRWTARIDSGAPGRGHILQRVGWEPILFEPDPISSDQRFVYRPAGWLRAASDAELALALAEAESIRVSWGVAPPER
jgi:hypothetical protein